jgi:hypothetical protein
VYRLIRQRCLLSRALSPSLPAFCYRWPAPQLWRLSCHGIVIFVAEYRVISFLLGLEINLDTPIFLQNLCRNLDTPGMCEQTNYQFL